MAALKSVRPAVAAGQIESKRFFREVEVLGRLNHPNIVRLQASGECAGLMFFCMDFVPGFNGAELVRREGTLPAARAVAITLQLLDALEYAHCEGVVHRDVKPANVMVTPGQGRDQVSVLDFGLARAYQLSRMSGITMVGAVGGSAAFMAPEQVIDFRGARPGVDQYSAAATLYYLLTGRHTRDFPADFQASVMMLLTDPLVPLRQRRPDIPEPLARAAERALASEPSGRFPSCAAFADALRPFAGP
jgi:serine/threonine-protein kinase